MSRAETDAQYKAIAATFEELKARESAQQKELESATTAPPPALDAERQIQAAMTLARRLTDLADQADDLSAVRQVIELFDDPAFLAFRTVQAGKRTVNRLMGGIVTFGNAPPPIAVYQGATARKKIKAGSAARAASLEGGSTSRAPGEFPAGEEEES